MVIINPTGKSDKNQNDKEHKNKYLIDEVLEKFNQTSCTRIFGNKNPFFLYHILGYLCNHHEMELIFTHTVSLNRKLLKNLKRD